MIGTWGRLAPTLLLQSLQAEMWSLPRRNHHRQYMPARNGDHATMCGSDWRSSRNVAQPALPKPQVRAFVRRSKPSHRLTGTASSDPSSQTYPPSRCPLSMVDTISALYNASEHTPDAYVQTASGTDSSLRRSSTGSNQTWDGNTQDTDRHKYVRPHPVMPDRLYAGQNKISMKNVAYP